MNFNENIYFLATSLCSPKMVQLPRSLPNTATPSALSEAEIIAQFSATYTVQQRAAIIPVHGVLSKRHTWEAALCNLSSYERIESMLQEAQSDSGVDHIVLDIESPGGSAHGVNHTARLIQKWDGKPITAFYNDLAASAAVYLGSGATRVMASPDATIGSIGCVYHLEDISRYLNKIGIDPIRISVPEHKAEGPPNEPISAHLRAEIQKLCEDKAARFFLHVAETRMIAPDIVADELAGNLYTASEALSAGLIDTVGTLENALTPVFY